MSGGTVKCWGWNSNGQVILFVLFENSVVSVHVIVECDLTICFYAAWRQHSTAQHDSCSSGWFGQRSSVAGIRLGMILYVAFCDSGRVLK